MTEGFKTDCDTKAKNCRRFCKDLTPDKSFSGLCLKGKCKCVTYPHNPDKKNACTKAINKLKKIEDQALRCLGLPVIREGSSAEKKLNAVTDKLMGQLHVSKTVEGCTPEDIQNLKGIISNLAQGINFAKSSVVKSAITGDEVGPDPEWEKLRPKSPTKYMVADRYDEHLPESKYKSSAVESTIMAADPGPGPEWEDPHSKSPTKYMVADRYNENIPQSEYDPYQEPDNFGKPDSQHQ